MSKLVVIISTFLCFTLSFSQPKDKVYRAHDHNYSTDYSYSIREIIIHSDSTFTQKNYSVSRKKDWKTYKKYTPEISKGKITKKGDYYILTEYRNGHKTDFFYTTKIKERKLIFFFPNRREKMRRTYVYRRIATNK
jgi:hypothetical protein